MKREGAGGEQFPDSDARLCLRYAGMSVKKESEDFIMNIPKDLLYTKSHEWVRMDGDSAYVGLTDYAQDALGDLVFVNLPEVGDEVEAGEAFADVESVKAVSDVYSALTGEVEEVNEDLLDAPEKINEAPYEAWLVKVGSITDREELLSSGEYEKVCGEEA